MSSQWGKPFLQWRRGQTPPSLLNLDNKGKSPHKHQSYSSQELPSQLGAHWRLPYLGVQRQGEYRCILPAQVWPGGQGLYLSFLCLSSQAEELTPVWKVSAYFGSESIPSFPGLGGVWALGVVYRSQWAEVRHRQRRARSRNKMTSWKCPRWRKATERKRERGCDWKGKSVPFLPPSGTCLLHTPKMW
jgi:hypothetical protein